MRNILAHQYLGVSIEATWAVVEKDLQPLKIAIIKIAVTFGTKL
ncbi:MAG: HepT-like ribonuclease domain-containing protein [Gammaproteobacteria bacterium]